MTRSVKFAQLSDIHISALGDHGDMLSGRSAGFLSNLVTRLNRRNDLDFVLITGDLFDTAAPTEVSTFQRIIGALKKRCYVIPGNHDRRDNDAPEGLTRHDFARLFNPQVEQRSQEPAAQAGYWSLEIEGGVQLIGLDSIIDGDWSGLVDSLQMAWLNTELERCAQKLVIVAVHHALHPLAPIDAHPYWQRFVLENGPDLLALLDRHPQVKMVLTGHHHLTRVDRLGQRLHLACPALSIYPCAYRTIRLEQNTAGWQVAWQTHSAAAAETIAEAKTLMVNTWQAAGFEDDFVVHHLQLARGAAFDRYGRAAL